ncbi:hypothetical protein NZD89_11095 [Alicyclobacillus fastidiosus]|uniref:Uncharacterized protein n=1 Tax=Alicyclobacillus fastidiosus TaxID=392011 RepID=A0ABY6ZMT4_9BACL|nr:hypothetical protein [Alicyclobacillus fastidiosus]WAH43878.1 hypothetical protein NZD89_11095 [Alicyclobacillus fastidiosus]GMA60119.1 hypothetical protein GCM10025859_05590 [Alicyclobacillus fastidiosus]
MFWLICVTLPIAVAETCLLYTLMKPSPATRDGRRLDLTADVQRTLHSGLMRFTFSMQLVMELCTGSKTAGCIFSFAFGVAAGIMIERNTDLKGLSDILMNVFMGISMGVFLIGHLPLTLTLLLIAPVLVSSGFTLAHTVRVANGK